MNEIKSRTDEFLKKYGIYAGNIDIGAGCETFINEMEQGLKGEDSSLGMLCTYLSPEGEIPVNEPVIVMDAGGTNFRVAVVTFDNDKKPVIEDFKLYPMPGTQGEISREEFFDTIAQYLLPVINKSSRIGFCFSYPTEILPNKDGKLIRFNKEVKVRDMKGEEIGKRLLEALKAKGADADKKFVILNDTVATLLGGKAAYPDRKFESFIGFILGTGTNTCYIEENANIHKAASLKDKPGATIINIESGGYAKAPRGEIDNILDSKTVDPGTQLLEKMISGAYQGSLVTEVIRKAISEGLFSKDFEERFNKVEKLNSKDIDEFCAYPYSDKYVLSSCVNHGGSNSEKDRLTLYYLIDGVFERAARLVAINLASIILKTGKGKNPLMPVCVTAERTTFYKSKLFRPKLDYYVRTYLNDTLGIYCEFVKAENATLIGTAIAGLLN